MQVQVPPVGNMQVQHAGERRDSEAQSKVHDAEERTVQPVGGLRDSAAVLHPVIEAAPRIVQAAAREHAQVVLKSLKRPQVAEAAREQAELRLESPKRPRIAQGALNGGEMSTRQQRSAPGIPKTCDPTFSPDGGDFLDPVSVVISSETAGAAIRYTLDGSDPTEASPSYSGPVEVSGLVRLRARAFAESKEPSSVAESNEYRVRWGVLRQSNPRPGRTPEEVHLTPQHDCILFCRVRPNEADAPGAPYLIVKDDAHLSRKHCFIQRNPPTSPDGLRSVVVKDLSTHGGVHLNGSRVSEAESRSRFLRDGDRLALLRKMDGTMLYEYDVELFGQSRWQAAASEATQPMYDD